MAFLRLAPQARISRRISSTFIRILVYSHVMWSVHMLPFQIPLPIACSNPIQSMPSHPSSTQLRTARDKLSYINLFTIPLRNCNNYEFLEKHNPHPHIMRTFHLNESNLEGIPYYIYYKWRLFIVELPFQTRSAHKYAHKNKVVDVYVSVQVELKLFKF